MPRVLITRAPHQASPLADALRAAGIEPILIPAIEIAPPTSLCALDAALACLPTYHWLVFTSANAVEHFFARLKQHAKPYTSEAPPTQIPLGNDNKKSDDEPHPRLPASCFLLPASSLIAVIGPATARALQPFGIQPALIPPQAVAESLAAALAPYAKQPDGSPTRFLLPRAEAARDHLPDALTAAGADVTLVPVYRNVIPTGSLPAIRRLFSTPASYPDAISFTSSSSVTNLLALLEEASLALPSDVLRISIGPITSATLQDHGLPPHAEASQATIPALVEKLSEALFHRNK